jgi:hypothetical protein
MFLLITNKHSVTPYKVYTVLLSYEKLIDNTELLKENAMHHSVRLLTLPNYTGSFSFHTYEVSQT